MIRYQIVPNRLQEGKFYARVISTGKLETRHLLPNVVEKTALSDTDVRGVLNALRTEIADALAKGMTVELDGLVRFSVSLSGSYDNADVIISRNNAALKVNVRADLSLQQLVAQRAEYERVEREARKPIIRTVLDAASEQYDRYTPGGIIRIKGSNLAFDKTKPDEGVFVGDGTTEKRLSVYAVTGEKEIIALMPADVSGDLTLRVRTRYTPDGELREGVHLNTLQQT